MSRYLVISPNNYGNVGDDICAYAGKRAIEIVDPKAEIEVSQPPMRTKQIEWADYVILSGGGILYDRDERNVDNYLQYIDKAYELGKKSAVLGVGMQGIVTDWGRKRYQESLAKCEFVSVRTDVDKRLLDEAGFKDSVASFDIAYLTPEIIKDVGEGGWLNRLKAKKLSLKMQAGSKPKIGICMINLRMLKGDNYAGGVFEQFDKTIEEFIKNGRDKFDIYLLQHAGEDAKVMKPLADKYGVQFVPYKNIGDLPALFSLYKSLDMMLGVRLHSIALGLMADIPVIGIGSNGAKQKRLAGYGLPTLKNQFYTFDEVDKLAKLLEKVILEDKLPLKTLTEDEKRYITEKNNINIELLREMIS